MSMYKDCSRCGTVELTYTDASFHDVGLIEPYDGDFAYGNSENDFSVDTTGDSIPEVGAMMYAEGSDIGGIVTVTGLANAAQSAAATSHTHTKSQITDFPSSLNNPNSLTISLNGTSQGAYDGSAAKSINVTPASIGAAASSHNHDASNIISGTLSADRIPTITGAKIAADSVSLAKLGSDVGTVAVQSAQPSDTNVKLWIQI